MPNLLSNLVNNLAEVIQKTKCKNEHDNKKYKTCETKYKDCYNFLNTQTLDVI